MSKALSSARGFFGRYATEAAKVGARGGGIARYASGMSNSAMASAAGAGMGGAYGLVSDDTSVLGGALGGAAMGFGGMKAYGAAARGLSRYGKMTARGVSRSSAASYAVSQAGRDASAYIGNTLSQAPNAIRSTLKKGRNMLPGGAGGSLGPEDMMMYGGVAAAAGMMDE
jgi:hypothetical protein